MLLIDGIGRKLTPAVVLLALLLAHSRKSRSIRILVVSEKELFEDYTFDRACDEDDQVFRKFIEWHTMRKIGFIL